MPTLCGGSKMFAHSAFETTLGQPHIEVAIQKICDTIQNMHQLFMFRQDEFLTRFTSNLGSVDHD